MKSSQARLSTNRITVNLAPADIKKQGPSFDLSIAVWLLLNESFIENDKLIKDSVFLWELALDWKLRKIPSVLPATIEASKKWFRRIFIPKENSLEASIVPKIDVIPIDNLKELIDILNWEKSPKIQEKLDFKKI